MVWCVVLRVGLPAATLQVLDKALVRPGRFDKQVSVPCRVAHTAQHGHAHARPCGLRLYAAVPICCALVACARSRVCAGMERGLR
jgi:hypothetical protein